MFWSILCLFKSWYKCSLDLCSWYQTKVTIYINWDHMNFSSIQPLKKSCKSLLDCYIYTKWEAAINVTECGFRYNWLWNVFDSSLSISRGKKLYIINHTWLIRVHCAASPWWTVIPSNNSTAWWRSFTPKQCKARQSWACWWRPCSAWQTPRWRSGADAEAAELCEPLGWHRWY